MPLVNREIYSYEGTIADLLANLKDGQRGIITDTPGSYFNHNWLWRYDGNHYVAAVSKYYDGVSWVLSDAEFGILKSSSLRDSFVTGGIALGESGNSSLLGSFTATSIVGALNELKGEIGGDTEWNRVTVGPTEEYVIPNTGVGVLTGVDVGAGLTDDLYEDYLTVSEPGEINLDSWFSPNYSIVGCLNKLANGISASVARNINGFLDRTDSTLSFVGGATRTLYITPVGESFTFYSNSERYTVSAEESIQITDVSSWHYIYYDDDGDLAVTTTFDINIILRWAFVSAVLWSSDGEGGGTAYFVHDERHGYDMASETHLYNHMTFHTRYQNDGGLALSNMTVNGNGSLDSHAQFGVTNGVIWDEDIQFSIVDDSPQDLSTIAQIPMMYLSGTNWVMDDAWDFPVIRFGPTGRLAYNSVVGGSGSQVEVANNNYVLMHYYATTDIYHPIIGIQGQNEYANLTAAREAAKSELINIELNGLNLNEFKAIATVIFVTGNGYVNTVKAAVVSLSTTADYQDWRLFQLSTSASSVSSNFWLRDSVNGYLYPATSTDNLGIGTSTPLYKLDIFKSTGQVTANIESGVNTESQAIYFSDVDGDARAYIQKYSSAEAVVPNQMHMVNGAGLISFYTGTGGLATRRVTIDNAGNTGFGRVNPSTLVELYKDDAHPIITITAAHATDYDPQIQFRTDASPTVKASFGVDAANDNYVVQMGTGGVGGGNNFCITPTGNVGIGTNNPLSIFQLESSAPTLIIKSSISNGNTTINFGNSVDISRGSIVYDNSNDNMFFTVNNLSEAVRINSSGNVGIGVSPTEKFQVAGNIGVSAADGIRDNDWVGEFSNLESTNGRSFGVVINAGSTFSDTNLLCMDHDSSNILLKVAGNGFTGVGTSPSYKFDVVDTVSVEFGFHTVGAFRNSDDTSEVLLGYLSDGASVEGPAIISNSSPDSPFFIGNSGYSYAITISEVYGQVGINNPTPAARFDVVESSTLQAALIKSTNSGGSGVEIWGGDTTATSLKVCDYVGSQRFKIIANGGVFMYSIKKGATQAAAGAATDELWKTLGHATLPDDVLMVGA